MATIENKQVENTRINEIRSDEIQDILSQIPNWITRWGITLIFILLIAFFLISWFLKYPDKISGKITITTEEPVIKLFNKTNGYISKLHKNDKIYVRKGDVIAEVTNPTNQTTINYLKKVISAPESLVIDTSLVLGNLQVPFSDLVNYRKQYNILENNRFRKKFVTNLKQKISYNNQLASIVQEELRLSEKEFLNATQKFHSDSLLYSNKIISKNEFFLNQTEFLKKKRLISNTKKSYLQLKVAISEYERQLNKLEEEYFNQKAQLLTNINSSKNLILSYIQEWQQVYTISSPIDGQLSHLKPLMENQFIESQKPLFAIIPKDKNFIGFMEISSKGYGNVKIGQRINIKLDKYPYHEFGILIGEVHDLSAISTTKSDKELEKTYLIKVKLPQSLITTYMKEIAYSPEMSGSADIITDDLRIIQRMFNNLRTLFN